MTTGGRYILENLYTNNKEDEILLNRDLLDQSIKTRCKSQPFLLDMERTHISYIKKYFKPVIPMAFEFREEINPTQLINYGLNRFSLQQYGDFTCEIILNLKLSGLSVKDPRDKCGYYDFPGHKIIKNVAMNFAGNIIDQYSGDAYNVHYNYYIPEDKKKAWLKVVGQEYPEDISVRQDINDDYDEKKYIVFGPQTPKASHEILEINIPIIFEFCQKMYASLFSNKIKYGQRFLDVILNQPETFCYGIDYGGGGFINYPTVTGSLWINQIFIEPKITEILLKGTYRTFMRVYKETKFTVNNKGHFNKRLDKLKFATEHLFFGLKPTINAGPNTWWRYYNLNTEQVIFPVRIASPIGPSYSQLAFRTVDSYRPSPTILFASFASKSSQIVNKMPNKIYSEVYPLLKAKSQDNIGLLLYSFAKNIYDEQPSSYYNISTEREFHIHFEYDIISGGTGEFYILSKTLNWMEIDEKNNITLMFNI